MRVVLAYDVRQFEDKRKQLQSRLAQPGAAPVVAGPCPVTPPASTRPTASTPTSCPPTARATWPRRSCPSPSAICSAHGGLNISASHNPPDDNGGKFYDERGGQPVPPDDQIMADLVDQVTTIKTLPWAEAVRGGKVHFLDDAPHQAYIDLCRKQSLVPPPKLDEIQGRLHAAARRRRA